MGAIGSSPMCVSFLHRSSREEDVRAPLLPEEGEERSVDSFKLPLHDADAGHEYHDRKQEHERRSLDRLPSSEGNEAGSGSSMTEELKFKPDPIRKLGPKKNKRLASCGKCECCARYRYGMAVTLKKVKDEEYRRGFRDGERQARLPK